MQQSKWINSSGWVTLIALSKGFLHALAAKHGSHIGRLTLAIGPKRPSLANLAILSFPMCPSQACHVDELIVILQSITKVDEVED